MRICTPDKVARRRRDNCGSPSCHLEHLASSRGDRKRTSADGITARAPVPKGKALLCSARHLDVRPYMSSWVAAKHGQILLTAEFPVLPGARRLMENRWNQVDRAYVQNIRQFIYACMHAHTHTRTHTHTQSCMQQLQQQNKCFYGYAMQITSKGKRFLHPFHHEALLNRAS